MLKKMAHAALSYGPSDWVPPSSTVVPSTDANISIIVEPIVADALNGMLVFGATSPPLSASSLANFELLVPVVFSLILTCRSFLICILSFFAFFKFYFSML